MNINLIRIVYIGVIAFFVAACGKANYEGSDVGIYSVVPNYVDNSDMIEVSLRGKNADFNKNKLFLDDIELEIENRSKSISFIIPDGTFDEYNYSRVLSFHNGYNQATFVLYYKKFPRFLEVLPGRAFVGEELTIEGENLVPSPYTEILFEQIGTTQLIPGKITYADNYTIRVTIPENSTGNLFYKNTLGKEATPRVIQLDKFVVSR